MFNVFLIIHAFLAITLIIIILIQRSDGGALGGIGGGSFSGMLTGRSSANFLTKMTAVIAALFLGNSLLLAILSGNLKDKSIVNETVIDELIQEDNKVDTKPIVPDTE
jgi:preprotein translocase subunit SecG